MRRIQQFNPCTLGAELAWEMCKRIGGVKKLTSEWTPIMNDLRDQRGYCLDAPDEMPGGSCYNEEYFLKGEFECNIPKMLIVRRE